MARDTASLAKVSPAQGARISRGYNIIALSCEIIAYLFVYLRLRGKQRYTTASSCNEYSSRETLPLFPWLHVNAASIPKRPSILIMKSSN